MHRRLNQRPWEMWGDTTGGYAGAFAAILLLDITPTWTVTSVLFFAAVVFWVVSLFRD